MDSKLIYRIRVAALMVCLISPASVASPAKDFEALQSSLPDFVQTGEQENCINTRQIRSVRIIDKRHILFRLSRKDYVVNQLPHPCRSLRRGSGLQYSPISMRLCQVDTIRIIDNFSYRPLTWGPACGLGKFHVVVKKSDPAQAN